MKLSTYKIHYVKKMFSMQYNLPKLVCTGWDNAIHDNRTETILLHIFLNDLTFKTSTVLLRVNHHVVS